MHAQLDPFGVSEGELRKSPILKHDPETERFTGDYADIGGQFLKREYRAGYEVPDLG
ncbi:MAG: hypothetical protein R3B90_15250 [Planctomycetaceae bacterium]